MKTLSMAGVILAQWQPGYPGYPGPSGWHYNMMGGGWGIFMFIFMLIFLCLIVGAVVLLVRYLSPHSRPKASTEDALEILRRRYARGEIQKVRKRGKIWNLKSVHSACFFGIFLNTMKSFVASFLGLLLLLGFESHLVGAEEQESSSSRQILRLGQEVYQVNCAVCHGVAGDGNGPAASMFAIRPRDFRAGIFKFRSTPSGTLPTDDDLLRTVTRGVRWTAMIGRPELPEYARRAVIQYIKTFSSRFAKEQPGKPVAVPAAPTQTANLVAQGQTLYDQLGCAACHGKTGQGNGPSAQGLKDDWGWTIWPSDLRWRPLKRGSDIREAYLTLLTGVSGTPMPSYGSSLDTQQAWALAYYLESLVPPDHRLDPNQPLGEEPRGWMVVRMGAMMGGGIMGPGMMRRFR